LPPSCWAASRLPRVVSVFFCRVFFRHPSRFQEPFEKSPSFWTSFRKDYSSPPFRAPRLPPPPPSTAGEVGSVGLSGKAQKKFSLYELSVPPLGIRRSTPDFGFCFSSYARHLLGPLGGGTVFISPSDSRPLFPPPPPVCYSLSNSVFLDDISLKEPSATPYLVLLTSGFRSPDPSWKVLLERRLSPSVLLTSSEQ